MKIPCLLLLCSISCFADDFILNNGTKLSGNVSRAEPDGLVLVTDSGIVKLPFSQLPSDVRKKYNYDAKSDERFRVAAATAASERSRKLAAHEDSIHQEKSKRALAELADKLKIQARVKPYVFGEDSTTAEIVPCIELADGKWQAIEDQFDGVITEAMPKRVGDGDVISVELYEIGLTADSSRRRRFTLSKSKAMEYLSQAK